MVLWYSHLSYWWRFGAVWMASGFQVGFLFLCFTCSKVGGTVLVCAFVLHSPVSRKCLREVASELLSPVQGLGHVKGGGEGLCAGLSVENTSYPEMWGSTEGFASWRIVKSQIFYPVASSSSIAIEFCRKSEWSYTVCEHAHASCPWWAAWSQLPCVTDHFLIPSASHHIFPVWSLVEAALTGLASVLVYIVCWFSSVTGSSSFLPSDLLFLFHSTFVLTEPSSSYQRHTCSNPVTDVGWAGRRETPVKTQL